MLRTNTPCHDSPCLVADVRLCERMQQSREASSSGRCVDDACTPSNCDAEDSHTSLCENHQLMTDEQVVDLCMLCAYGMDLAALTPRVLQTVEDLPGVRHDLQLLE